jgi:hypothetical protein
MEYEFNIPNCEESDIGSGVDAVLAGLERIFKRDPERDGEVKNLSFVSTEILVSMIKAEANDNKAKAREGAIRIKEMAEGFARLAECAAMALDSLDNGKYDELRKQSQGN